jgi:hypothetical protein
MIFNSALALGLLWLLSDVSIKMSDLLLGTLHLALSVALVAGLSLELRKHLLAKRWNLTAQSFVAAYPCFIFAWIVIKSERIDGMEAMLLVFGFWLFVSVAITWWLYRQAALVDRCP